MTQSRHGPLPQLDPATWLPIIRPLVQDALSDQAIAARISSTWQQVRNFRAKNKLPSRSDVLTAKQFAFRLETIAVRAQEERAAIVHLVERGLGDEAIADRLHMPLARVVRVRKASGVQSPAPFQGKRDRAEAKWTRLLAGQRFGSVVVRAVGSAGRPPAAHVPSQSAMA